MSNEQEHKSDFNLPGINPEKMKENPFKTPNGYFEDLTPRMVQIASSQPEKSKAGILESMLKPQFLAPAFGIAAIVAVAFFMFNGPSVDLDQQFAELANDLQYDQLAMLDNIDPIDLVESDLINIEFASISNTDDISDYLLENDVELSTLVDEITL
ncbi:MAG: hypothetical protein ACI9FU_000359 [Granulosicoccus sp.]|jgi:hypothetical protein